jgi:hypothetical protein
LNCLDLSLVAFESGCCLTVFGDTAFAHYSSLQPICIPSSMAVLTSLRHIWVELSAFEPR